MLVKHAKALAQRWAEENADRFPAIVGAYLGGSIAWMDDDAQVPATSDVDIYIVTQQPPEQKLGKFLYNDLLMEVSFFHSRELASVEQILSIAHLAAGFSAADILLDPSGRLSALQADVRAQYANISWVRKRCATTLVKARQYMHALDDAMPLHAQANCLLFGSSLLAVLLLVADLRNPTVRRRYVDVRELLAAQARLDVHEELLGMLGCAQMTRARAEVHLAAMTTAFDAAKQVIKTPYQFAADLSDSGRPIAVDGSRHLIEQGLHREALFWIAATYARCQHVLQQDATPYIQEKYTLHFVELLADLGIETFAQRLGRVQYVEERIPAMDAVAEAIMAANPNIIHP